MFGESKQTLQECMLLFSRILLFLLRTKLCGKQELLVNKLKT